MVSIAFHVSINVNLHFCCKQFILKSKTYYHYYYTLAREKLAYAYFRLYESL